MKNLNVSYCTCRVQNGCYHQLVQFTELKTKPTKGNLKDLNYELSEFKVKFLESCDTKFAEELWKSYHSDMMLLQEKFIPTRVVKPNPSLPWITNDLRKLLKET